MNERDGSVLLIVMTMTTLMSVLVLHVWFIMGFACEVAMQEQEWYQHFYTTDMILNVGLSKLKQHFAEYMRASKPIIINLSQLLSNASNQQNKYDEQATIMVQSCNPAQPDALFVTARYYKNRVCVCSLRCVLKRTITKDIYKIKDQQFVVSHFTLGNRV